MPCGDCGGLLADETHECPSTIDPNWQEGLTRA